MTKRRLTKLIMAIVGTLLAALLVKLAPQPTISQAPVDPGFYRITAFHDGDTITVDMNGTPEKVRFIGVDTPETHKPNAPVQCYGPEASAFTKQFVGTQNVRLEADPKDDNRDRYGRLLRYVYTPDGTLLSQKLIAEGYGFAYTSFPFTKKNDFVEAQIAAQNAKKGLWAACEVTEKKGRFQTQNL